MRVFRRGGSAVFLQRCMYIAGNEYRSSNLDGFVKCANESRTRCVMLGICAA